MFPSTDESSLSNRRRDVWVPGLAHLPLVLWLFSGPLFEGRVLYFRDISSQYYPAYVFVERALKEGVWPLWNPMLHAGSPYLLAYPPDLLLLFLVGAKATLALSPPLHALLGMWGASMLGRRLGMQGWGAWTVGAAYGVSGYFLSCVNLVPLHQAASWAPWVLEAFLACLALPTARRVAILSFLTALQMSTLAGEIALQTAVAGLFLVRQRPHVRALRALGVAGVLTLLLASPAIMGTRTILEDTARARGFSDNEAFAWSASPVVLIETVLPRFFGEVHTFSDVGYWGQALFPEGYPYLISLYLGLPLVTVALRGGRERARLWVLACVGVLLSLGSHGPLEALLSGLLTYFRTPVKFFFLTTLAVCLLAGFGLDRATRGRVRAPLWLFLPGLFPLLVGAALWVWPAPSADLFGRFVPRLLDPRARIVMWSLWPGHFMLTGVLAVATVLALRAGGRIVPLSGILASVDLLLVNGTLNPSTTSNFYTLQPELAKHVGEAVTQGSYRWFSYGVPSFPSVHWTPEVASRNSDAWLYYMDRQTLWGWTGILDGLEGAFEEDRTGWAPPHSAFTAAEAARVPYPAVHARLRLANVRWIVALHPLPESLLSLRGSVTFPEIVEPLRLYEVRDPLPRASWVGRCEVVENESRLRLRLEDPSFDAHGSVLLQVSPLGLPCGRDEPGGYGSVSFERLDPHTIRLQSTGAPGLLVLLEGFHRYWRIEGDHRAAILKADGRYWAIPTPGGERSLIIRYCPPWRDAALGLSLAGIGITLAMALRKPRGG